MFAWNVLIPIVLFHLAADAPDDKAVQEEMKNLQGTWKIVKVVDNGKEVPLGLLDEKELVFKGDEINVFFMRCKFRVNPANSPKAIDLIDLKDTKNNVPCIYELKNDELWIAMPYGPQTEIVQSGPVGLPETKLMKLPEPKIIRPTNFEQEKLSQTLVIAKRVNPQPGK